MDKVNEHYLLNIIQVIYLYTMLHLISFIDQPAIATETRKGEFIQGSG